MRKLMVVAAIVVAVLVGCDYTVSLVKTPKIDIDKAVVGLWERPTGGGKIERLLILPLDKKEYLVSLPAGTPDVMFGRACLCMVGEREVVQVRWFGTAKGKMPDDKQVYQYATYSLIDGVLRIRMMNTDLVKKDVDSSDALKKAIMKNYDNPGLFKRELAFLKVKE